MNGTVRSMIAVGACCAALLTVGACSGDGSSGPPTDISNQPTSPSSAQPPASVDRSHTGETNPGRATETSSGNTPNTPGSSSGGAGNSGAPPGG
jgi:hypothetical protein